MKRKNISLMTDECACTVHLSLVHNGVEVQVDNKSLSTFCQCGRAIKRLHADREIQRQRHWLVKLTRVATGWQLTIVYDRPIEYWTSYILSHDANNRTCCNLITWSSSANRFHLYTAATHLQPTSVTFKDYIPSTSIKRRRYADGRRQSRIPCHWTFMAICWPLTRQRWAVYRRSESGVVRSSVINDIESHNNKI